MSLFFDVLSAINNPNQQASVSQLATITDSIQQITDSQGIDAAKTQSLLSAIGGVLQPALKQQQTTMGGNQLENLLGRLDSNQMGSTALSALIPPQVQQQLIQGIAQKTGLSPNLLQNVMPALISSVLGLLNMGATKPGVSGINPLLSAYLNGNTDGNTDLGDVFKFATRFLNPPVS